MKQLDLATFVAWAPAWRKAYHAHYFAMYSTVFDAVTTDPLLMLVPMDDHMVHRGDGVFETFKCVEGALYNLDAHLDRVENSAAMISLALPMPRSELIRRITETVRMGAHRDCLVRLLVSRGPGGFGVNPYECPEPQVYIAVSALGPPFMQAHPEGARVCASEIPAKDAFFARTKNCNYLANALMKKEAVDRGVDFSASFNGEGQLAEGAAESMGIVTADGRLVFPRLEGILAGTTMLRLMDLCAATTDPDGPAAVEFADIHVADIAAAAEFLVVGTTINVVSVCAFDGKPVGVQCPGPIGRHLGALLERDIRQNAAMRTIVFA